MGCRIFSARNPAGAARWEVTPEKMPLQSGAACASGRDTVISVLRKLLAALAVVALLGPTGVALCDHGDSRACETATSHACCEGPRLNSCECNESDASGRQSEPAQPFARVTADNTPIAFVFESPAAVASSSPSAWPDASPPPAATRERLSLLSTLLV
jgi:hypothetical protein